MVPLNLIVKPISETDLTELIRLHKELIDEESKISIGAASFRTVF
jgi:hypothetical protein